MVLSVYQCKPRRNVTILSTQHQHVAISTEKKKKPETVEYYNHSKVGVDVLDQMARQYSVKGGTRRWPVAVFYNVLDLAAINAWVLYRSCMSQENIPRRDFMLQLAHELRAEWMASKAPPLADLPFSGAGAEERRRMTCMVKAHCMQNKTFCKYVKCGDAVCGKCTAKESVSLCRPVLPPKILTVCLSSCHLLLTHYGVSKRAAELCCAGLPLSLTMHHSQEIASYFSRQE
ncbi:hypothetical protein JOQ06_009837, partial [Pogonophryne albipinna]